MLLDRPGAVGAAHRQLTRAVVHLIDRRPRVDRFCRYFLRIDGVDHVRRNCHNLSGSHTRGSRRSLKIKLPFEHKRYLLAHMAVWLETTMRTDHKISELCLRKRYAPELRARIITVQLQSLPIEMLWNGASR